jgi:hypothetical protein
MNACQAALIADVDASRTLPAMSALADSGEADSVRLPAVVVSRERVELGPEAAGELAAAVRAELKSRSWRQEVVALQPHRCWCRPGMGCLIARRLVSPTSLMKDHACSWFSVQMALRWLRLWCHGRPGFWFRFCDRSGMAVQVTALARLGANPHRHASASADCVGSSTTG